MERALFAMLFCFVAGCDGESGKKNQNAAPIDDRPAEKTIAVNGPKPAATDAAAKQAVANLLGAHTKGQPSALEAFRNCIVKRQGEVNKGGGEMLPAECIDFFAWPDRYRADWSAPTTMSLFAVGESVLQFLPSRGDTKPLGLAAAATASSLEDIRATWLTLLVPLLDPAGHVAAIETDAAPGTLTIRVWIGSQPPHVLIVDAKTGLLSKVLFEKVGDGRRETWAFVLADFKLTQGVLLPHKVTYTGGRVAGAVWSSVEYEPVASFPAGTFERP